MWNEKVAYLGILVFDAVMEKFEHRNREKDNRKKMRSVKIGLDDF